jgi:hypothetical protein
MPSYVLVCPPLPKGAIGGSGGMGSRLGMGDKGRSSSVSVFGCVCELRRGWSGWSGG